VRIRSTTKNRLTDLFQQSADMVISIHGHLKQTKENKIAPSPELAFGGKIFVARFLRSIEFQFKQIFQIFRGRLGTVVP